MPKVVECEINENGICMDLRIDMRSRPQVRGVWLVGFGGEKLGRVWVGTWGCRTCAEHSE